MIDFDQDLTWKPVAALLAQTTNPRHKLLLSRLLDHCQGEVEGDLERVMGTLAPNPVYHIWSGGPEMNPVGLEEVRKFYVEQIFGKGRNVFESGKYRIVVDDNTIITEGIVKNLIFGGDLQSAGVSIDDPESVYLTTARMLIVWPFDADGYIIGEESWANPVGIPMQKVDWPDVPANFKDYVTSRRDAVSA